MPTDSEAQKDVVADAIAARHKADELRGAAIKELLAKREQIERDLKTLGYDASENGISAPTKVKAPATPLAVSGGPGAKNRFSELSLAQIGRILLAERGTLHGAEIEKLAKAGGFKGGTKSFQNYLPVAFKRAGGFENVGKNHWRVNEEIPPKRLR